MKYIYGLVLIFLLPLVLFAYEDYDMDGVDDTQDKCPNTLLTDLVDINGCTVESLVSPHHYDVILGVSYSQVDYNTNEKTDNFSESLQLDYYYEKFSLQVATSYFKSQSKTYSNDGLNDTMLAVYYRFNSSKELSIRVGAGVILPTYKSGLNNNKTDYTSSLSLSYSLNSLNIFGGSNYTIVNDDDIDGFISYQNSASLYGGLGFYPNSRSYISTSYSKSDSIYTDVIAIENISVFSSYSFNENWFGMFSYAYGLSSSASDHYLSLRIGYYY